MATAHRTCSIDGCNKPLLCRGLCGMHYQRLKRYGDPLAHVPEVTKDGEPMAWLLANVGYTGGECLTWPFYVRKNDGYGQIYANGRPGLAHRLMCELAHGDPPSLDHVAAHSCGRGHKACVNPRHLRWATHAQNRQDMVAHGTAPRGEKSVNSRLTAEQVRIIRSQRGDRFLRELAEEYGVSPTTISDACARRTWAWLD